MVLIWQLSDVNAGEASTHIVRPIPEATITQCHDVAEQAILSHAQLRYIIDN